MNALWLIVAILAATFAFALLCAALLPLALAAEHANQETSGGDWVVLQLDKLLVAVCCVPVFWFFLALHAAPEQNAAVRQAWSENRQLRLMFYFGCALVLAAIFSFRMA